MKNHLFCIGAEVRPSPALKAKREFISAQLNVYTGANAVAEALEKAEAALREQGYEVTFIRGAWVVDAACDDGFCPLDEVPSDVRGELLFSDGVQFGDLRRMITSGDYGY